MLPLLVPPLHTPITTPPLPQAAEGIPQATVPEGVLRAAGATLKQWRQKLHGFLVERGGLQEQQREARVGQELVNWDLQLAADPEVGTVLTSGPCRPACWGLPLLQAVPACCGGLGLELALTQTWVQGYRWGLAGRQHAGWGPLVTGTTVRRLRQGLARRSTP